MVGEVLEEVAEEVVLEPIFGEWLFTLYSATKSGLGQRVQSDLEFAKAATRAALFAAGDLKGYALMAEGQHLGLLAQVAGVLRAVQNAQAMALMEQFMADFQQVAGEVELVAEARNQQKNWDQIRESAVEALAQGRTHALEMSAITQDGGQQGTTAVMRERGDAGTGITAPRLRGDMTFAEAMFRAAFAYTARGLEVPTVLQAERYRADPGIYPRRSDAHRN